MRQCIPLDPVHHESNQWIHSPSERLAPMIDILDHATQHPMHQFMESPSSYLFHRASFTPMEPAPEFLGQLIRAQLEWLSRYLRTVTSCCEIHSLLLLLHHEISYISTIRGDIWRYRQRWVFFFPLILRDYLWTREKKNAVNELKGMLWDSEVQFSKEKDTSAFRQYLDACDRVKLFYQEQHGSFEVKWMSMLMIFNRICDS